MSDMYSFSGSATYATSQQATSARRPTSPTPSVGNLPRRAFSSSSVDSTFQPSNSNLFSSLVSEYVLSPVMSKFCHPTTLFQEPSHLSSPPTPTPTTGVYGSYPPSSQSFYDQIYRTTKSLFGIAGINFECAHHRKTGSVGSLSEETKRVLESLALGGKTQAQNLCATTTSSPHFDSMADHQQSASQNHRNVLKDMMLFLMQFGGAETSGNGEPVRCLPIKSTTFPSLLQKSHSAPRMFEDLTGGTTSSTLGGPASFGVAAAVASQLPELVENLLKRIEMGRGECRRSRSMSEMELASVKPQQQLSSCPSMCLPYRLSGGLVDSCGEDSSTEQVKDEVYSDVELPRNSTAHLRRPSVCRGSMDLSQNIQFSPKAEAKPKEVDNPTVISCTVIKPIPGPEERRILQKDRERKQERRRKMRNRRSRKKGRSSSDEDSLSGKSDASAEEFLCSVRPRKVIKTTKKKAGKACKPKPVESEDEEDKELIDFVESDVATKALSVCSRDGQPVSKCASHFFSSDSELEDSPETDDDVEWDEDESDHSLEDHMDILDMMGLSGCGLMLSSITSAGLTTTTSTATFCDTLKKSTPGAILTEFGSAIHCPASRKSHSSSAVDIPNVFFHATPSDHSSSFGSLSPDSYSVPLTEDDIKRNQDMLENEEKSRLAVEEANRNWAKILRLWKEEMGERAALLETEASEESDNDEDGAMIVVHYTLANQEIFDLDIDHADGASLSATESSPATMVRQLFITKNPNPVTCRRQRSVCFNSNPPEVFQIADADDCRDQFWERASTDRRRTEMAMNDLLKPVFEPAHRERIYRERFSDAQQKQAVGN